MFQTLRHAFQQFAHNLTHSFKPYPTFWHLQKPDFLCFLAMLATTLSIWLSVRLTGTFNSIFNYWDNPNYMYVAITLYKKIENNPWEKLFSMPDFYFACHLPGYPLLIRICSFLCFNNFYLGDLLSILVSQFLLVYSFRRLLIAYGISSHPTLSTLILSIFPPRMTIYHSVGSTEPLFLSFICLAFIAFKENNLKLAILYSWLASFTRIEGIALAITFFICYCLSDRQEMAVKTIFCVVPYFILGALHNYLYGNPLAYFSYNGDMQGLIGFPPFSDVLQSGKKKDLYVRSFSFFFASLVFGVLSLLPLAPPLGIFCILYLGYIGILKHRDIYRYALPCETLAYIGGLNYLLQNKAFRMTLLIVIPIYFVFIILYASGQIHSNTADQWFVDEVMSTPLTHLFTRSRNPDL